MKNPKHAQAAPLTAEPDDGEALIQRELELGAFPDERLKINPTRVPIEEKESLRWLLNLQHTTALLGEPDRCIHVGDRESDIYELFCAARVAGSHFLIRSCANRRADVGMTRLESEMDEVRIKGTHCRTRTTVGSFNPKSAIDLRDPV